MLRICVIVANAAVPLGRNIEVLSRPCNCASTPTPAEGTDRLNLDDKFGHLIAMSGADLYLFVYDYCTAHANGGAVGISTCDNFCAEADTYADC